MYEVFCAIFSEIILDKMATKIAPQDKTGVSYELYKQKLLAWREVTDLRKDKQGVVIAIPLPEDDNNEI